MRSARRRLAGVLTLSLVLLAVGMSACGSRSAPVTQAVGSALDAGPKKGSTDYVAPLEQESAAVAGAVLDLIEGRAPEVPSGYSVSTADDVRILAEEPVDGRTRGWGLYAVHPASTSTIVVEVPHPRSDLLTEDIGSALFAEADARLLLVAGAHRSASDGTADVAHATDSVFAQVDAAVVGPGWTVVQLHGFAEASHDVGAEAVVSSSSATPGPVVEAVAEALRRHGITACVYDGVNCQGLGGTRNVQGTHARQAGASFVHLELADSVRLDESRRDDVVAALTEVLRTN